MLDDEGGRRLVGLPEVDLGTMSHRRLRSKAFGYLDYAHVVAWSERHDFCPALLLATIAPRRALAFLGALEDQLERGPDLLACACGLASVTGLQRTLGAAWRSRRSPRIRPRRRAKALLNRADRARASLLRRALTGYGIGLVVDGVLPVFPNGSVITPDGPTLVVAESCRITAYGRGTHMVPL